LAAELGLAGWVRNSAQGAMLEAEGGRARLEELVRRLPAERPPGCSIQSMETLWLDAAGLRGFEIRSSVEDGGCTALVRPDVATCEACLGELRDSADRRHGYPFINCTHCGPRFSILEALPYDRANTSMRVFPMCPRCQAEYDDPANRRFHAQPNACPDCGPHLVFLDGAGARTASREAALAVAVSALRQGQVVAVKGLGGFHLMVLADASDAVSRLRARKHREEKPFAVMFPGLEAVRAACEVSEVEERLLRAPEAPIVLLRRRGAGAGLSDPVAPGNPCIGALLPYTPLHHLLLDAVGKPLVATSGNLSDEPICTDELEAVVRLRGVADSFLVHNRPIVRHVDDSIVRVMAGREIVLRRARGFAPLPVRLPAGGVTASGESEAVPTVLAVGAHLKNTVALATGSLAFLSQHIGDLETEAALMAFRHVSADLASLFRAPPDLVAADAHPDYVSTREALRLGLPRVAVQHHHAHVLACMAENELTGSVLGVSWDGTGYGLDGTVWGGEFLRTSGVGFERLACLRRFPLPGGDVAAREPWRPAWGLLYALAGESRLLDPDLPSVRAVEPAARPTILRMLERGLQSPWTSSVGRLFDAVASLADVRQRAGHEGQAAMELEFAAGDEQAGAYPMPLRRWSEGDQVPGSRENKAHNPSWVLDWGPMVEALLADRAAGEAAGRVSARFHEALVTGILAVARVAGESRVVLTGGCFQNRRLLERSVTALESEGFRVYWHQRVPPNDGGIALGQVWAARHASCVVEGVGTSE
jgi:hydrogenase maturation protein HypF